MPLDINSSRAARTHDQLVSLVRAIQTSSPEDESRSIEWKSGYEDLLSTEASFAISRAVLGLANRPVDVALTAFEGVGYVVVGAEPGSISGQLVPDSAELLNALRRYTGHGWPLWDPRSVTVDGQTVLVVTVEPPRPGDRIALLHKSFQPRRGALVEEGTVFVRQPGATERASRRDLDMLQDRLLNGTEVDAAAARAATRDDQLRSLIADMVQAAHAWARSIEVMVIVSAERPWQRADWMEWADTESGRAQTGNAQLIRENARKIKLLTRTASILEPLERALALMDNRADTFAALHGDKPSSDEKIAAALRNIDQIRAAFDVVEDAGAYVLSSPGTPDRT